VLQAGKRVFIVLGLSKGQVDIVGAGAQANIAEVQLVLLLLGRGVRRLVEVKKFVHGLVNGGHSEGVDPG
jgi:hypothetical protein